VINPAARLAWTETAAAIRLRLLRGSYANRILYFHMAEDRALDAFTHGYASGWSLDTCQLAAYDTARNFLDNPSP